MLCPWEPKDTTQSSSSNCGPWKAWGCLGEMTVPSYCKDYVGVIFKNHHLGIQDSMTNMHSWGMEY